MTNDVRSVGERLPLEPLLHRRVVRIAHPLLAVGSGLVVVAIVQAGWVAVAAVVSAAAIVLHGALGCVLTRPVLAVILSSGAMLLLAVVPMPGWSTGVLLPSAGCFLLVSWRVTVVLDPPWPRLMLAIGLVGVLVAESVSAWRLDESAPAGLLLIEAGVLVAVVVGTWWGASQVRARRDRLDAAERERLSAARVAERASVRRDLHDVIGHSLTLMVAQAEVARVGATDEATRSAVGQVAETGRKAIAGLRAMLRVLDVDPVGTALVPSIDALPTLVEDAATPAHVVTFAEDGERAPLAPDAETALVRAAQEGITNSLRHLRPPVVVAVRLAWSDGRALIEVADDGGAGARTVTGGGAGLVGLTERLDAAGGSLVVDRGPHGWSLTATVPTMEAP